MIFSFLFLNLILLCLYLTLTDFLSLNLSFGLKDWWEPQFSRAHAGGSPFCSQRSVDMVCPLWFLKALEDTWEVGVCEALRLP